MRRLAGVLVLAIVVAIVTALAVTLTASSTRSVVRLRNTIAHDAQTAITDFEKFISKNTQ